VLLDDRLIPTPPVAAGPDNATVPVAGDPPTTDAGVTETLSNAGGITVKVAVLLELPSTAEIVAVFELWSGVVATVNVPVEEPAAIVTEAGTVA